MIALLFTLLGVGLAIGLPVYLSLAASSLVALALATSIPLTVVAQRMFAGINSFTLMAVPFFIFTANVMNRGGLAPRIVKLSNALVGHMRGGIAFTVVLSCMFLGAVSGSAPATVVAICTLMLSMMVDAGYSKGFSIGLIMASASVAVIIPPSIGMIVFGSVTGTSVGELFIAGFLPGIVYGASFMLLSYIYARVRKLPVAKRASFREVLGAFKHAGFALGIPVVIIGGIYGGLCTPTEAAGISTVYAIIVSVFIYKELSLKDLVKVAYESAVGTAQVMVILAGAGVFAWVMTRFQVPVMLTNAVMALGSSKFAILMMINLILLVAGMFLDPASIQTIMSPLFLPVALSVGVNPVHLGIIMVVNGAIGMFTPPFGLNMFVASGVTGIPLSTLIKTVWPWVIVSILALLLITYVPWIAMALPNLLYR
ncbi:MAG: C4-dicarboxylate ABC transporter permease [Spirochaetae bacterium HGW-Spirochaetae-8]|nr:MAG: C4-dicarboxylate ABC transporter permease [Synergistetes bacterium HGW-Synergistetes-2]PKL12660.1 MAG: C4-dicarboxylate ABC transporter permease [Spirochaetae bacterium HGW-Spirochaetae-8]